MKHILEIYILPKKEDLVIGDDGVYKEIVRYQFEMKDISIDDFDKNEHLGDVFKYPINDSDGIFPSIKIWKRVIPENEEERKTLIELKIL